MPYIKSDDPDYEQKVAEWRETVDYYSKNYMFNPYISQKATKRAILPKTAVIVDENGLKNAKLAPSKVVSKYLDAYKTPVSIPNPNRAFRDKKDRNASEEFQKRLYGK